MIILILMLALVTFFLYKHLYIIQVIGDSMYPTLFHGEIYLGVRVYDKSKLERNEIYVFIRDEEPDRYIIKRFIGYASDEESYPYPYCLETSRDLIWMQGDNIEECSYDSRAYGFIDKNCIKAKILWRLFE